MAVSTKKLGGSAASLAPGPLPAGVTVNNANWSGTALALANIAAGTRGQVLSNNATPAPAWVLGSSATGDILYYDANGDLQKLAVGGASNFLGVTAGLPAWKAVSSAAGSVVVINDDEAAGTDVNNTITETTSKTYALAANSYSSIIVEADVKSYCNTNGASAPITVRLYIGASVGSRIAIDPDSTAEVGNWHTVVTARFAFSAALTAGGTVKVTIQATAASTQQGGQALNMVVKGVV